MNYIKYIHSVDGTTLYVKVNENVNSSANIIIFHYSDSLDFYKNISSSKKELHIYDGLQHEIFNERKKNKEIFSEIANWINNDLT
ncbi:serine aminopeptidase domain-containing protein [Staphylococcus aureus]|uniref:serine aminopeptidase domain-containing protein n=1 Tax=Staphylococcus aureus TaxID=1280 RepID=UPI001643C9A2|nr:alpha/beta hydrolase [Staphylococcus aureus]